MNRDDVTSGWAMIHSSTAGSLSVAMWEMLRLISPYEAVNITIYVLVAGVLMHVIHRHRHVKVVKVVKVEADEAQSQD